MPDEDGPLGEELLVLAEAQVAWLVTSWDVPSEKAPMAMNCSVAPDAILGLAGVPSARAEGNVLNDSPVSTNEGVSRNAPAGDSTKIGMRIGRQAELKAGQLFPL